MYAGLHPLKRQRLFRCLNWDSELVSARLLDETLYCAQERALARLSVLILLLLLRPRDVSFLYCSP